VSIIINSNLATSQSSLSLKRASERLSKSLQRISSGNRIVSPSEDAGGLAVAMKLESSLRRATATMNNTQNGLSFLQMQDGALKVAGEIVDRMAELKSFYNDVSKNSEDRENYNYEFKELQKELASLKSQKFNGVSLFATDANAAGINIMTSDDGLGDPIELSRTGLFENLKSKFGADGKLNTGSSGEYRQLVGNYSVDGGVNDANPGYTTRDYSEGDVVYRNNGSSADSGYFMALKDLVSGMKIEDTGDMTSSWIRIADGSGNGFSEAYPDAPTYDMNNLRFNAQGKPMAYLKGDTIKVQAHWDDANSFIFLKAENDVPQNILIDELLLNGIGQGRYFDYVGLNQTSDGDGNPTNQFRKPNSKYASPLDWDKGTDDKDSTALYSVLVNGKDTISTPSFVEDNGNIYSPLQSDWKIKDWDPQNPLLEAGDLVLDSSKSDDDKGFLFKLSDNVKGAFVSGAEYEAGDFVLHRGEWSKTALSGVVEEGDDGRLYTSALKSSFPNDGSFEVGDVYQHQIDDTKGSSFYRINERIAEDELIVFDEGKFLKVDAEEPRELSVIDDLGFLINNGFTTLIKDELGAPQADDPFWVELSDVSDPLADTGFAENHTQEYSDLENTEIWSKSYYSVLNEITVSSDYNRGDNIYYQGKHYVYVSDRPSSDELFGGDEGVNDFEQLLLDGAIKELGVYVDATGSGGSSTKSSDSFYQANQDLEFVDRLPGSGLVRASGAERRANPAQGGDGVFNSVDDLIYNQLNAGNDGIYGTVDDFYSATPYRNVALNAGHTDSDADNNKDLLDLSNDLSDFSVADFVDYTQSVANFRAVNGGTMSRINYANRILEENKINLESARGRIMDTDISLEASKMARQNVIMQASAAMVTQANQMNQMVLQLLQ